MRLGKSCSLKYFFPCTETIYAKQNITRRNAPIHVYMHTFPMDYNEKQNSASLFHCKWFVWHIIYIHTLHIQSRYTHLLGECLLFWTLLWQNHSAWEIYFIFSLSLAFSANCLQDYQLFNCLCNLLSFNISKKNSAIEAILLDWDILCL